MDVAGSSRRTLRRRLVAAVLLLAVVVAVLGWLAMSPTVHGRAAVVIVPPQVGTGATPVDNPLLELDDNLVRLATVLETAMQSPSAVHSLHLQDAGASFTVSTAVRSGSLSRPSPQLIFTVTGSSSVQVRRTAAALVSVARDQLDVLQTRAQVPGSTRASLMQVVGPSRTEASGGARLLRAVVIGVVVALVGAASVAVWGSLSARRAGPAAPPRPRTRRRRRELQALALDPAAVSAPRSR